MGKGAQGKGPKGVRHTDTKKGKGKVGASGSAPEKRIDPSDGNGPFTQASFIKYHGPAQGMVLWEKAGKRLKQGLDPKSPSAADGKAKMDAKAAKAGGRAQGATQGPKVLTAKTVSEKAPEKAQQQQTKSLFQKKTADKPNNPFMNAGSNNAMDRAQKVLKSQPKTVTKAGGKNGGFKSAGKNFGKKETQTDQQTSATTKGAGKKGGGKQAQEKRIDPSDANGPFSHASFLKYHGQELGQALWDQAGKLSAKDKAELERRNSENREAARAAKAAEKGAAKGSGKAQAGGKGGKKGKGAKSKPAVVEKEEEEDEEDYDGPDEEDEDMGFEVDDGLYEDDE